MIALRDRSHSDPFVLGIWFLMAFQAGYVNTGGFMAGVTFVSHVTGFGTSVGIHLAAQDYRLVLEVLSIPIFFIFGAFISSYNITRRKRLGLFPNHIFILSIKSLVFFTVFLGGVLGIWGVFGDKTIQNTEFLFIPLLAFACGLQNATCSQLTNGFLKPTHLTGLSTDIGIGLADLLGLRKKDPASYQKKLRDTLIRIGQFVSFSSGAFISYQIFAEFKYFAFLFPFSTSLVFLMVGILERANIKNSFKYKRFGEAAALIILFICLILPFSFKGVL